MAGPVGFIHLDIVGDEHGVQRLLNHLDSAMSPVGLAAFLHGAVEPWLVKRAKDRFAGEGDDAVGKWAPLTEATAAFRENSGFSPYHPINKRTGELEDYITSGGDVSPIGVQGAALKYPGGSEMTAGLREKVKTAQTGKSNPSTPRRPVLGMNETDLAHVMTALAFYIQKPIG